MKASRIDPAHGAVRQLTGRDLQTRHYKTGAVTVWRYGVRTDIGIFRANKKNMIGEALKNPW